MDAELFVNLHTLSATPVVICRHLVLQQALQAVGLSMHETTTYYEESNEMLTTVKINVPLHISIPRLKTTVFYGNWSLTAEAAVQSACFAALAYLEEVNIITIDCIHSAELKHCRHKLLEAKSWSEAFEGHATKLESQLAVMCREKEQLIAKKTPCEPTSIASPNNLEGSSSRRKTFQSSTGTTRRALFLPTQTMELPTIPRNNEIGGNKEQPIEPADDGFNKDTILTASSAIHLLPVELHKKCEEPSVKDETNAADKENNP